MAGAGGRQEMLTPDRLSLLRLRRYYAEQYKVWKQALDWTVCLYLIVPALVIGGGLYIEWLDQLPAWSLQVPWTMLPVLLFLYMLLSPLRAFVEEADKLFLLQRPGWINRLRGWGMVYTALTDAILYALVLGLLFPFLTGVLELSAASLLWCWLYTVLVSLLVKVAQRQWLEGRRGWRSKLAVLMVQALLGAIYAVPLAVLAYQPMWQAGALLVVVPLLVAVVRSRLRSRGSFELDMLAERSARLFSTSLLMSQVVENRQPLIKMKRPLFFPRSGRLFKSQDGGAVLAELRIKAFIRSGDKLWTWVGFISLSSLALLALPPLLRCLVVPGFILLGMYWQSLHWKVWTEEPLLKQFKWEERTLRRGRALSRFWMIAPATLVWSIVAGMGLGGAAVVWLPAIVLLIWYSSNRTALKRAD